MSHDLNQSAPDPGHRPASPGLPTAPFVDRSADVGLDEIAAEEARGRRRWFRAVGVAVLAFVGAGLFGPFADLVRVAMILAGLALLGGYFIAASSARFLETSRWMTGATTPYQESYSRQQALVMQGRVNEALASYEEVIAGPESDVPARRLAAELYAGAGGNPRRAAELFREILSHPRAGPGDHAYATNRLVDLLTGPLNEPGKAMGVLRQFIDRYPGTPAAANAREALRALKGTGSG